MAVKQPKEDAEAGTPPAAPAKGKFTKKTLIIAGVAGAILIGGGGGAAMMLSGGHGKSEAKEEAHDTKSAEAEKDGGEGEGKKGDDFIDVPPMVVNLRAADGATRFLKVHFMLAPGPAAKADELKAALPLLQDGLQPFLRELRPEDLAGSAAVFRIKEEMLIRATATLGKDKVKDVLIQDLIQQ